MITPAGSPGTSSYFDAPLQGIRRGVAQANEAAQKIAQGDLSPENMVAQIQAEAQVAASVAAARSTDETVGTILNLTA